MIIKAFQGSFSGKGNVFLYIFFGSLIIALIGIYQTLVQYKKVWIDKEFLYVSNFLKEIKIPLSNIAEVTESKWLKYRPITIALKTESELGRKIMFVPKYDGIRIIADNPIVYELKNAAEINNRRQFKL